MQSEIISWYDWQWHRVQPRFTVPRDEFIRICIERSTELYVAQCAYIAACCCPDKSVLDSVPLDEANNVVRQLYGAFLDPGGARERMVSAVQRMEHDGKNALSLCILPQSATLCRSFYPVPVFEKYAHYRKASNRVYLFLKSLGKPDKEVRTEFIKQACNICEVSTSGDGKRMVTCSPYEQHLMLDASEGGKTSTVFLDFYAGAGTSILLVREKDMAYDAGLYIVSTRRDLAGAEYTQSDENIKNPDGEKYAEYYDLLVNAWVAEKTGLVERGEESKSEHARVDNIVKSVFKHRPPSDHPSVRYEYIKVTDRAWQMHTEAQRAFKERSSDCKYTKQFWWRRPHFAFRGLNTVYIKGHWCHRRCGEVVEVDEPQVIEVLT